MSRLATAWFAVVRWRRSSEVIADAYPRHLLARLQDEMHISDRVTLCVTPYVNSAATVGWRHPLILLPQDWQDWPSEELEATLAHELAHIAARDWPTWLLAQVAVTLHFYHPLVHWLARRLRLEQELAADATAATVTGNRDTYLGSLARQMLRADKARLSWAAQTFLPTRSTIVRRIEMLKSKSFRLPSGRLTGAARVATVAALALVGLLVAGLRGPGGERSLIAQEEDSRLPDVVQGAIEPRPQFVGLQQEEGDTQDAQLDPAPLTRGIEADAAYVPDNAVFVLRIRPNEILSGEAQTLLRNQINGILADGKPPFVGLRVEDIDSVVISPTEPGDRRKDRFLIRFKQAG